MCRRCTEAQEGHLIGNSGQSVNIFQHIEMEMFIEWKWPGIHFFLNKGLSSTQATYLLFNSLLCQSFQILGSSDTFIVQVTHLKIFNFMFYKELSLRSYILRQCVEKNSICFGSPLAPCWCLSKFRQIRVTVFFSHTGCVHVPVRPCSPVDICTTRESYQLCSRGTDFLLPSQVVEMQIFCVLLHLKKLRAVYTNS